MSDITVREVHARIRQSVAKEVAAHRKFRNDSKVLRNCSIHEVQQRLTSLDPEVVAKDLCDQFDVFLKEGKATVIDTSGLTAGEVFKKFFANEPPFAENKEKKHEFPDAFAIQALAEWARTNDTNLLVVSGDELFREACGEWDELVPKSTLNEVLDHVASDDLQRADIVRKATLREISSIKAKATEEFEGRYYWVSDKDGSATVKVKTIELWVEPEIVFLEKGLALLQMALHATYEAKLSYNDLDTASYDPEDGALIYAKHREEKVEREELLMVEVQATLDPEELEFFDIQDISVIGPSGGFGIETEDAHERPYK